MSPRQGTKSPKGDTAQATHNMKVVYCIIAREDSKGVFYTVDTVRKGGVGGSTPFDQKPTAEEVNSHLLSVYPEMTESIWHINHGQTPEEIASLYF